MEENVAAAVRFALDVAFKATVLLAITALALVLLKRASAAARQLVATLGLAGSLLLPAATLVAPHWELPLLTSPVPEAKAFARASRAAHVVTPRLEDDASRAAVEREFSTVDRDVRLPEALDVAAATAPEARPIPTLPRKPLSPMTWMLAVLGLWSAGTALALARLALGAARVRRVCCRASPDADPGWRVIAGELSAKLDLQRPVGLLFSEELAVPVTTGLLRPVVLLPEGAHRWNEERRRVVLLHELAHVKRADSLALLLGQTAAALYWFHPLAWTIRVQMRNDCERACDDLVLAAGTRASVYAAHLLSIIRSLRLSHQRALPAVAMARRSYWDGRMRAILDPAVERRTVSPVQTRLAAGALFAAVVALAALEPWTARKADAMSPEKTRFFEAAGAKEEASSSCPEKAKRKTAAEEPRREEPAPASPAAEGIASPEESAAESDDADAVVQPEPNADAVAEPDSRPAEGFEKASKKTRHEEKSWYERGMSLHNEGRYDEAIDAFRRSIDEGERVEAATYNIGCGYAMKGEKARAFEWLQKAIDEGFEVGSYLARDDDLDSLRSDPRFAELRRASKEKKVECSRAQGERLATRYEHLKSDSAARGKAFYEIGKKLLKAGRHDLAADAFQTSAARGYRQGASLYNTACAYSLKGEKTAGLESLGKALDAGFDDPHLVRTDDDLDNLRGEPRYRELVKMAGDLELHRFQDFAGHKQWLRSSRQSAWREVEQHFEDYTRRHPESARAWFNLGYARIEGDRAQEAIPAFRRALDMGYRKPTTMYNLACAYSLLDQKDEAFGWLFKALDAGFDASGTLRGDDDLDNLRGDPRFRQALARAKDKGEDWSD
jgi:beta-lactamase regulating signal transducer with metallopeptidase domain/tetratricopeptide (TPR) repeat protein